MTNFVPIIHPWNQQAWQNLTLEPERANHALLFNGGAGLGKSELAFALAHFVLTDSRSQSESLFAAGSHPDLHVIMPESEIRDDLCGQFAKRYVEVHSGKPKRTITVEQVRRLSAALTTHPHISSHRVIVIYHAETMNRNASNALLKSLEEPPSNTLFIIVTDDPSQLVKTIRSRCSLINFRAPDTASAKAWLSMQNSISEAELDTYLAMANGHPLLAIRLVEQDYLSSLKTVFTDVNGLWMRRAEVTEIARNWQKIGAREVITILQKLTSDLLKAHLNAAPLSVFFPVQQAWVASSSSKLSKAKLIELTDELNYANRMLATTVDELLVLESVSNKIRGLPA